MRRTLLLTVLSAVVLTSFPDVRAQTTSGSVIFVHGMGASAADQGTTEFTDLLQGIARRHPNTDACTEDAQPDQPWTGSPCVFRYVEDKAETDGGFNDSQSAVRDNANKLADEIDEMADGNIVLVGYSMGGAIIRTYLAEHLEDTGNIAGVVLIDAVASGSWGYQFASALPRRVGGPLGNRITELMRTLAATSASVNFERPATRDLSPRSELFRDIAPMALPDTPSYYTFWGDIRVVLERSLLGYDLPDFTLPSVGDLGLLPGDPDPTKLPEFGGQRFSPETEGVALDIPHRARIKIDARRIGRLIEACSHRTEGGPDCRALAASLIDVPNTHTAVPKTMAEITVDEPVLGGKQSLLDAVFAAIGRHL